MNEDALISRKVVVAFFWGICAAIQDIDAAPPESRSSERFLELLQAALENISLHNPDLSSHEIEDLNRLYLEMKEVRKTQDLPRFENFM